MKNILKITLGLLVGLFVASACNDSDDDAPVLFSVDKDNITIAAAGGSETIIITSAGEWSVSSSKEWVRFYPSNGFGNAEINVVMDSTTVNDMRTADIRIESGAETKFVTINQTGFDKMIVAKDKEVELEWSEKLDKRFFEVEITTNISFEAKFNYLTPETDWLEIKENQVKIDDFARPRSVKMRFEWNMNTEPMERVAEIKLTPINSDDEIKEPAVITVRQKPSVKIEDNRAGDSVALITIYELLNSMNDTWDTGERMDNWEGVTLWESTDEDLPCPEAAGRVRSVSYAFFRTEESFPTQIKHLKYLESFDIMSNVNTMLKSIELGPEICELNYLKELYIFSYGLVSLPDEFVKLGKTLEVLDLSANNFNEIPAILNEENFPKLKKLNLTGMRRWTLSDLRKKDNYDNGIGLHFKSSAEGDNQLRSLFLWENLEELRLQNCYIEGQLPDFEVGKDGVVAYTQADVDAFGSDTIQWLADNDMPKILPNMKLLAINLNFFTGDLPDWLLYHPKLMEWFPELLIYNQQEKGYDSEGNVVKFDNYPTDYEYYYKAFPKMRGKYEIKDEIEDEE